MISFFISGILAGLAAFAYGPMYAVFPYMADAILLNAFVVVVLGGLGNVGGAAVCGLFLGLLKASGRSIFRRPTKLCSASRCFS